MYHMQAINTMPPKSKHTAKSLSLIIIIALTLSPLIATSAFGTQTTYNTVYNSFVQNYSNTQGNFTYVEKPMFPVQINNNQIPVGENWTIVCPLLAGHNYHIYFYGSYVNTSAIAGTDYDVYVYGPQGNLVSSHLESAGLPPHLGTTTSDPLFTPTQSGNYSFVISNSPFGSQAALGGTFMIIESLQTNTWYTTYLEGTGTNSEPTFYTDWAYEFVTNASTVQVYINVPNTLDVYEARLYLMDNNNPQTLDSYPLPIESALYGNYTGSIGGYNFDPNGYRGVAYASDEYCGQNLVLNFTSPNSDLNLYQLVLIGGQGSGNVQIMMKTDFSQALTPLTVPSQAYTGNQTQISYSTSGAALQSAQLSYTTDDWNSSNVIPMQVSNQTCTATIPGQQAGSLVQYSVNATDLLENTLQASGSYIVKNPAVLNINAAKTEVKLGQNITITGTLTPSNNDANVSIEFADVKTVQYLNTTVDSNGYFTATWKPNAVGTWAVSASTNETAINYSGYSQLIMVTVTPPPLYVKYGLFIVIGFVAVIGAGIAVYVIRGRRG